MRVRCKLLLTMGLGLCAANPAMAQLYDVTSYFVVGNAQQWSGEVTVSVNLAHGQRFPLVLDAPFSAQEELGAVGNGTAQEPSAKKIVRARIWRDSLGRFRVEQPFSQKPGEAPDLSAAWVAICDATTQQMYVLDTEHRIAHRFPCLPVKRPALPDSPPPPAQARPRPPAAADPSRPVRKIEKLGEEIFGDTLAEGVRTTVTIPVGYRGNDRPISSVTEEWNSTELRLMVLSKMSDPETGETRFRQLTNITRTEPDPALFQLPPGYTVVDEAGSFQFTMARGGS